MHFLPGVRQAVAIHVGCPRIAGGGVGGKEETGIIAVPSVAGERRGQSGTDRGKRPVPSPTRPTTRDARHTAGRAIGHHDRGWRHGTGLCGITALGDFLVVGEPIAVRVDRQRIRAVQVDLRAIGQTVTVAVRYHRVRPDRVLGGIVQAVPVRISRGIVGKRVQAMNVFPEIGQSVAIGVEFKRVRLGHLQDMQETRAVAYHAVGGDGGRNEMPDAGELVAGNRGDPPTGHPLVVERALVMFLNVVPTGEAGGIDRIRALGQFLGVTEPVAVAVHLGRVGAM